jgi:trigger factor
MALKITTEPRELRQLGMTIEVDPERVQRELRKAAQKFANDYRIPGFRKGKAPYHVIVQQVGLPNLYSQFVDELGQELFKAAIEQEGITPYATATLEDVDFEPMKFKLLVPLDPEVNLGDYRALRVEEDPATVDEAEVEARLESYRDQHAGWQELNRPRQYGDMLNINVHSVLIPIAGESGESTDEETVVLDESDWDVTPDQENPMEPPGFDEALIGMQPGDEKEFVLSWPADGQSVYAGKQARFQVKLNKIQAYEKPELTDEFAQLVGPDFATLDDLKANIRETLAERAKSNADSAYADKALNAMVERSTLVYPPVVIEDQLDTMIGEFERQLRQLGIDSLETYLQRTGGQTLEDYRERLRPEAKRLAEQNLILSEVLRAEKLQVSDEEIGARIKEMMGGAENEDDESARSMADMLRSGAGRSILESQILREKALQRLLAIARGEAVPDLPPADETPAEASANATPAEPTQLETAQPAEPMTSEPQV